MFCKLSLTYQRALYFIKKSLMLNLYLNIHIVNMRVFLLLKYIDKTSLYECRLIEELQFRCK